MIRQSWTRLRQVFGSIFKKGARWWFVLVAVTVVAGIGLSLCFWEILHNDKDSFSTTISNLSLLLGGIVAIELAVWRSIVSERQTTAAQRQAATAQLDLLNQQLQKGAEMLGNSVLSVRLGAIYTLKHLALKHPEQYHVQAMQQLCAFVRGATGADDQPTAVIEKTLFTREKLAALYPDRENLSTELTIEKFRARNDIQEAMNAIAFCHDRNISIETTESYWLDLQGADLRGVALSFLNLSRAPLRYYLPTTFYQMKAIDSYTNMRDTILDDASLFATNIARVDLSYSTGLTQAVLDLARVEPDDAPKLDGVIDAQTGKPIVWNDSAEEDE